MSSEFEEMDRLEAEFVQAQQEQRSTAELRAIRDRFYDEANFQIRKVARGILKTFLQNSDELHAEAVAQELDALIQTLGWQPTTSTETIRSFIPSPPEKLNPTIRYTQRQWTQSLYTIAIGSRIEGGIFVGENTSHLSLPPHQTYLFLRPQGYVGSTTTPAVGLLLENFPKDQGTVLRMDFIPAAPPVSLLPKIE